MNGDPMHLTPKTMAEIFPRAKIEAKPRQLRQAWLKDVGFDEAPWYHERMGLLELKDFLEVTGEQLDYVKICTPQVIYHPGEWVAKKIKLYQSYGIEPYLDHGYFKKAWRSGVVEDAIVAGAALGFRVIEFMNTFDDVTDAQWKAWRQLALDHNMKIIYEHHPRSGWYDNATNVPAQAESIVRGAAPFLEHGAFTLMMDHEEIELHGKKAEYELGKVIEALGRENIIFEITSPKEAPMRWLDDLTAYFEMWGPNINVSNVMPSQAMYIEPLRAGDRPGPLIANRY